MVTRGETIGVVAQRIALVVIADGVAEVDGISGIGLQRVDKFHLDSLARGLYLGHLNLWRRHDDILGGIIQLDELIELNPYFLGIDARSLIGRRRTDHPRRVLIEPTTVGIAHSGTADQHQQRYQTYIGKLYLHTFFDSLSAKSSSMFLRLLLNRGTLCCPPNLPLNFNQSWNKSLRALTISNCCNVISWKRLAS